MEDYSKIYTTSKVLEQKPRGKSEQLSKSDESTEQT